MSSDVGAMIAFGFIALLILFIGWKKGFFEISEKPWLVPLNWMHVVGAFAIYFLISYAFLYMGVAIWKDTFVSSYVRLTCLLSFTISTIVAIFLALYLWLLPKEISYGILRRTPPDHPLIEDVWSAIYAWILAFPLVIFLSQTLEALITKVFGVSQLPDQVAVKFLKSTFNHPTCLFLTVISIVILAPLIEETLFRGFLQSYIRKHLGRNQAIFITSVCFSFFHFAFGQGVGNIMIIISLFALALFLGFIYEKQGSILAPMALHCLFNTVSVINLYMFGRFSTLDTINYLFGGFTSGLWP